MFAMPTCTDGKVLSKYAEECWRPGSTVRHLERESMSDGILRVMSSPLSSLLYNTNPPRTETCAGRSRRTNCVRDAGRSWLYVSIGTVTAGTSIQLFAIETPSLLRARQYRYNPVNPRIRRNGSSTVAAGINAKFFHAARRVASRCPGSWLILHTAFSISVGGKNARSDGEGGFSPAIFATRPVRSPMLKT